MTEALGAWLRRQREARGWSRPDLARRLVQAGRARGDRSMPGADSVCHNIYRWERGTGNPSERYKLRYCDILGIQPSQYGPGHPGGALATSPGTIMTAAPDLTAAPPSAQTPNYVSDNTGHHLHIPGDVAYRGMEADMGRLMVEQEVLMAAHEHRRGDI